jgi:tetratricopeptide (TPR) repeat protein
MGKKQRFQPPFRPTYAPSRAPPLINAEIERALVLHQGGQLDDAEQIYRSILRVAPRNFDAIHLLGVIHCQRHRPDEGERLISQAIKINPLDASSHNNHANVLKGLRRLEDALASYDRAIVLKPDYAEAFNNRGNLLKELLRLDEALDSLNKAIAIRPEFSEAHNNLANVLELLGRFNEAITHYLKALSLRPSFPEALYNLGNILMEQRRFDEALVHYGKALSLKPNYADVHASLGWLHAELGRPDEAIAAAKVADQLSEQLSPRSHYWLGALLARCGDKEVARKHLQVYLQQDSVDARGGRLLLASLGFEQLPERAPDALLDLMYTRRAACWDHTRPGVYQGHALVATCLDQLIGGRTELDIVDAGCGTGLVGARIRHHARHLVGVDLSAAMLGKAEEKGLYDSLHQDDLVSFLAARDQSCDVVTCAATLIHFGELRPAFEAAATALRDGGLLVLTLFPNDDDDSVAVHPLRGMAQGGCYVHGRCYIAREAEAAQFSVELLKNEIHEIQNGNPITGSIVGLRRRPRVKYEMAAVNEKVPAT